MIILRRLTESDFLFEVIISRWWPWRHFTQISAATCWMQSICRCLCSSVQQFLIYSTFVFVLVMLMWTPLRTMANHTYTNCSGTCAAVDFKRIQVALASKCQHFHRLKDCRSCLPCRNLS